MNTLKRQFLLELFRVYDLVVCVFAFFGAMILSNLPISLPWTRELISMRTSIGNFFTFLLLLILWHIFFITLNYYDSRRLSSIKQELIDMAKGSLLCTFSLFALNQVYPIGAIKNHFIFYFLAILFCTLTVSRFILRLTLKELRKKGVNLRHVVIVGTNDNAMTLADRIRKTPELGYNLKGFIDYMWKTPPTHINYTLLCDFAGFKAYLRENIVDEVFICLAVKEFYDPISLIIKTCSEQGILIRLKTELFNVKNVQPRIEYLGNDLLLTYTTGHMRRRLLLFKKVFDFLAASILLILSSPVMLLAALAIRLTSPGPVFFIQERLGFNKRKFKLYKFRTMVADAELKIAELEHLNEMNGATFKLKNDPRITPAGKILRKLSIDEFPQLINVLKGDMSLVGPRPLPMRDFKGFNSDIHRRRFCVKPGITCLWQVSGRSNITFEQWMDLDMMYIDQWSPLLDFKILLKTVPAVLMGHGAS